MRHARLMVLILVCLAAPAAVATGEHPPERAHVRLSEDLRRLALEAATTEKDSLEPHWRKVGRLLRERVARGDEAGSGEEAASAAGAVATPAGPVVTGADGALRVTVHAARLGASERRKLRAAGFRATFSSAKFRFTEGWLAASNVEAVARLDFVTHVGPTLRPIVNVGAVTSEGDAILLADQARTTFGVTGAGVKVGVLSDSVDGLASAVASGDLPGNVQILKPGQGSGEGTAMLEIVHDLAPGAALAFYGPASSGDMITGINSLAAAGAGVIVDDLTFFDQPHFEEGPLAQTVNMVAAQGVVYATSSGNFAQASGADRGHYEAAFSGVGSVGGPTTNVHDFGAGDTFQEITVLPGAVGVVFLQWANRFGQAGDDYDLYVTDPNGLIVASSDDPQDGDDLPAETAVLDNRASAQPVTLRVVVDLHSGAPRRIEMYYSQITDIEHATAAGSIAGHANASGAITVGAINAGDPANDDIAVYSSQGPCDLFFPSVVTRDKPEVAAIDGVAVTGAAGFPSPFFGTSAAAPHVAAVAALMIERRPLIAPSLLRQILLDTAADLGAPGPDLVFGAGRVDALAAVGDAGPIGAAPVIAALAADLDGDALDFTGTATDVEGDIEFAKVAIFNAASTLLAETGFFSVGFDGLSDTAISAQVTGLNGFPTAVTGQLVLADGGGNFSAPVTASFAGAENGAPLVTLAKYSRSTRTLSVFGTGFAGALAFEVNGVTLVKVVKLNQAATKAKVTGGLAKLNLRKGGPNRIRVLADGLHSNILILNL